MAYRHDESVSFHFLVKLLLVVQFGVLIWVVGAVHGEPPWVPVLVGALLALLVLMFGRLRFRVDEEAVTAEFGYLGWPSRRVPLSLIDRARVVSYRPLMEFGGWGIRFGKLEGEKTGVYSLRGNRGVLLELNDEIRVCIVRTRRFLLGSEDPERLAAAIGKG